MKIIKHITLKVSVVTLSILLSLSSAFAKENDKQQEKPFAKELAMFAGYLGSWESSFPVPEGKPPVIDVSKWERALNGKALRTLHSINNGDYGGESLIFFDNDKKALVFYYFTTANFYTHGSIELIDDHTFVAYEDVTGNENGITKVKSTSQLLGDKITVSTSYLKNGEWTPPETRTYVRSNKEVVFK